MSGFDRPRPGLSGFKPRFHDEDYGQEAEREECDEGDEVSVQRFGETFADPAEDPGEQQEAQGPRYSPEWNLRQPHSGNLPGRGHRPGPRRTVKWIRRFPRAL